jgi:large subunit ribosomal protein L25
MKRTELKAEKRTLVGRKVKKLRNEGVLPGNIYGKNVKSTSVGVNEKDFSKAFGQVGETGLLDLALGKETRTVLVANVQVHPVSGEFLHVDFKEVNLKEKVSVSVPVELIGEAPAEKQGLGTLVQLIDELEVEALPMDLPEKFEVDVDKLTGLEDVIIVKDIKVDSKKVKVLAENDQVVAKVEEQKKEEEVAPAVSEAVVEGAEASETVKPEGQEEAVKENTEVLGDSKT